MVGSVASGFLAVWLGTFNAGVFCFISAAITLFAIVAVEDLPGVVCFATFYGIFYSACFSLSPILLGASLFNRISFEGCFISLLQICLDHEAHKWSMVLEQRWLFAMDYAGSLDYFPVPWPGHY
ncbi:hypothetical protein BJ165DRAFT_1477028 [Panaeolus papilionaceus]|nr:hypothetical protein BJ165DRAFT_1477028 [Panaeolus papilionaceus]